MKCTPIEEKAATVRVLEWAGTECLYQVRVLRLEAWTAALIQDADTPNWGWEVVVRADKIAAQVCTLWDLRPERMVLIWQEDECWPRWMAWLRSQTPVLPATDWWGNQQEHDRSLTRLGPPA